LNKIKYFKVLSLRTNNNLGGKNIYTLFDLSVASY